MIILFLNACFNFLRTIISDHVGPAYFLANPILRLRPTWYLPELPQFQSAITNALRRHAPAITTIKTIAFNKGDLDSDGIHLLPMPGIQYLMHLIDQPK